MGVIVGFWRRIVGEGRRRRDSRRTPEIVTLEGRALLAVNGSLGFLHAVPSVLPPNGQYITVQVNGEIGANHMKPPTAYFFVTDEYRTVEPSGIGIPLTYSHQKGVWDVFTYSFSIQLQAKRSTRTFDGRHYDLFVGAKDADGTDGLTTQIFVPKTYRLPATSTTTAHPQGVLPRKS